MEKNLLFTLLTILLPLLGASVGYLVKHVIEKKKELLSEITRERRQFYQEFVDLVINIFSGAKTDNQFENKDFVENLYNFYKKYVLYASPKVITLFSDYFQYLYKVNESGEDNLETHLRKLSKIMQEMRKDLGLSNKELGEDGEIIFRAIIKDFDQIINQ